MILCLSISRCATNNKDNKKDIPKQTQDSVNLTEKVDSSSSFFDEAELEKYVDSNETPLEVIVLSGERKGQTVFVNELDLTIVY